jgi:hypothetical protein
MDELAAGLRLAIATPHCYTNNNLKRQNIE